MTPLMHLIGHVETTSSKPVIPERELLIATLERAVLDYYGSDPLLRLEAEDWLFGDADSLEPFSFDWTCDHLRLNPFALRERIKHLHIPNDVAQAHRWIRTKVQSRDALISGSPLPMKMTS